jgi:MFS superfamily sulfate permease-like transporter
MPGLVIYRFDAPLFFANARTFSEQITRLAAAEPPPKWILIAAEPISDIDTTAADMLTDLVDDLHGRGTQLVFAELKSLVRGKLEQYGLTERLVFFPTLNSAGKEYRRLFGTRWGVTDPPPVWPVPVEPGRREDGEDD